ncbi:hypothetical protein [Lactobacillus helveticus]|uniref:hypothetical protein n=1 Tax=Lactobacillus helveticus TaxID=1587 RepID=UPI00062A914E|nr:hypothetical protein [Lactobacillus helveticus]AKG66928.1 hypothetical protein TU99_06600 [Lactobacillus helveticus]
MLDHLLFNNQSWYSIAGNADNATVNGKKYYAVPSKITIKQGTSITTPVRGGVEASVTGKLQEDFQVNCVGANANHYFFVGFISDPSIYYDFEEGEGYGVGEVLKSDCKNIVW